METAQDSWSTLENPATHRAFLAGWLQWGPRDNPGSPRTVLSSHDVGTPGCPHATEPRGRTPRRAPKPTQNELQWVTVLGVRPESFTCDSKGASKIRKNTQVRPGRILKTLSCQRISRRARKGNPRVGRTNLQIVGLVRDKYLGHDKNSQPPAPGISIFWGEDVRWPRSSRPPARPWPP